MDTVNMRKNNKGVSLIEIIIVIAIMTIVGGTVILTTRVATDKHVNSCALKLASSLEQTRNLAMGKQGAYLDIWQDPGDYVYVQIWVNGATYGDPVAIGRPGITINVTGGVNSQIGAAHEYIHFSRSNGSVTDSPGVTKLRVTNGSRIYDVNIDTYTGRVTSEIVAY